MNLLPSLRAILDELTQRFGTQIEPAHAPQHPQEEHGVQQHRRGRRNAHHGVLVDHHLAAGIRELAEDLVHNRRHARASNSPSGNTDPVNVVIRTP